MANDDGNKREGEWGADNGGSAAVASGGFIEEGTLEQIPKGEDS